MGIDFRLLRNQNLNSIFDEESYYSCLLSATYVFDERKEQEKINTISGRVSRFSSSV